MYEISPALEALALVPQQSADFAPRTPTFTVPMEDTIEFSTAIKKPRRRDDFIRILKLLEHVHSLRGGKNWVVETNALGQRYAHIRGVSGSSLRRKHYLLAKGHWNWRVLIPEYAVKRKQPACFVQFLKAVMEQHPRSVDEAINKLREMFAAGAEIPGYGTWRDWWAREYQDAPVPQRFPRRWPDGWSPKNLRRYAPSRAQRLLYQQGYFAAHAAIPSLKQDPSKLLPLQLIVIDDVELDHRCTFLGNTTRGIAPCIAPVAGLVAMDVATRKHLAWLLGPRLVREEVQADGTVREVRTAVSALAVQDLLHALFRDHGLPDYEITILCENATAAISPELELFLGTIYGGRIKVKRTGLLHHKTLANGFIEKGGAYWQKGWIESDFSALHTILAPTPGYKGSNQRLNGPRDFKAKLQYAAKFLTHGTKPSDLNLPPEIIAELHLPYPSEEELFRSFSAAIELREWRCNHRYLGFDVIADYFWSDPALPAPEGIDPCGPNPHAALAVLTPEQQISMRVVPRMESSIERWERLSRLHPRRPLDPATLALFFLTPAKATYRNHGISIIRKVGGRTQGYGYPDQDHVIEAAGIPQNTELLAHIDFAGAPDVAVVTEKNGNFLGVLRSFAASPRGVDITVPEEVKAARQKHRDFVNGLIDTIRQRPLHQATDTQLGLDRLHNESVVAAWKSTPAAEQITDSITAAKALQKRSERHARATEDLAAAAAAALDANFRPADPTSEI